MHRHLPFQAGAFLLPLLWWGGLEGAFTTPKLLLIAALDAAVLPLCLGRTGYRNPWPWLLWTGAAALAATFGRYVSLEALLLALLPLPLAWALWEGLLPGAPVLAGLRWGSAVESAVAILQYCRLDPLALFWRPDLSGSPRMRVYGTLGNPDFVAAWLCATLPLWGGPPAPGRKRLLWGAGLALQVAAIAATGSRVFLVALPAIAAVLLLKDRRRARWLPAAVPVAAALVWLSPARPLAETAEGRMYLARVAASRLWEVPVLGFGPGSFRLQFVPWQLEWLRAGRGGARFAGPVDHAHNDYLEFFVEYGPAGLAALLALSARLLWRARSLVCSAAAAALLAVAAVDFPLHRAAEWTLYWLLLGISGANETWKGRNRS